MTTPSRVTIHMVASLDGFARKDGSVDSLKIVDSFEGGETLDPAYVRGCRAAPDGGEGYKSGLVALRHEVRRQA